MILKNLILILIFLIYSCANIKEKTVPVAKESPSEVVNCYIDALTNSNPTLLKKILNDEFIFQYGNEHKTASKVELLNYITKEIKDCKWDCKTSFEIIQQTSNRCIAKVNFKFHDIVYSDYIILHQSNNEWQIHRSISTL